MLPPPPSPRSSEDSLCIRAHLRPTFSHRRTADYRNPNSGEKPVRRRKAPAPMRVVFAGAGAGKRPSAPIRVRSPEKSVLPICQLRPTFSRRRKSNYRNRNSVESPVRRTKAPAPTKLVPPGAAGVGFSHNFFNKFVQTWKDCAQCL